MYWLLYISVIYVASIIPLIRWNILDVPDQIIAVLLVLAAIQQSFSLFGRLPNPDVARIYNTYALLEFVLISLYFNYSRPSFRKRHLGIVLGGVGVALGVLNMMFIQRFDAVATYFMFGRAAVILLCCLAAFLQMPLSEHYRPTRSRDFWVVVLLLCSVCPTLIGWLLISITGAGYGSPFQKIFFKVLLVLNLLFYVGMAIFFLSYHKRRRYPENGIKANRLEEDNY